MAANATTSPPPIILNSGERNVVALEIGHTYRLIIATFHQFARFYCKNIS